MKLANTLAFMFETRFRQRVTQYAAGLDTLQDNYIDCWRDLKKNFDPNKRDPRCQNVFPSSEMASWKRQWPAVPTFVYGGINSGTIERPESGNGRA